MRGLHNHHSNGKKTGLCLILTCVILHYGAMHSLLSCYDVAHWTMVCGEIYCLCASCGRVSQAYVFQPYLLYFMKDVAVIILSFEIETACLEVMSGWAMYPKMEFSEFPAISYSGVNLKWVMVYALWPHSTLRWGVMVHTWLSSCRILQLHASCMIFKTWWYLIARFDCGEFQ